MTNLPVPRDEDRTEAVQRISILESRLRARDGPLSISTAAVPEATDVPRAGDLDYPHAECGHEREAGREFLFDGPHIRLAGEAYVGVDGETFIEDVAEWA